MENKKKLLTPEELEQVAGGVLKPIQIERGATCQYCGEIFKDSHYLYGHLKICPKNPNKKN
jgi:hypothetical protein